MRREKLMPVASARPTDITRIDTIFANAVAAHGCINIVYLWNEGTGFDHVPIRAIIDADAYHDTILSIQKPVQIQIRDKLTNNQPDAQKRLSTARSSAKSGRNTTMQKWSGT
jgi:hypothetical protein